MLRLRRPPKKKHTSRDKATGFAAYCQTKQHGVLCQEGRLELSRSSAAATASARPACLQAETAAVEAGAYATQVGLARMRGTPCSPTATRSISWARRRAPARSAD